MNVMGLLFLLGSISIGRVVISSSNTNLPWTFIQLLSIGLKFKKESYTHWNFIKITKLIENYTSNILVVATQPRRPSTCSTITRWLSRSWRPRRRTNSLRSTIFSLLTTRNGHILRFSPGREGHWAVYKTSPYSFILKFSHSLA